MINKLRTFLFRRLRGPAQPLEGIERSSPEKLYGAYGLTYEASPFLTPEVLKERELLRDQPISDIQFDEAATLAMSEMSRLPFGLQTEYLSFHRNRFFELDNIAAKLIQEQRELVPRVLDVGMSVNTLIIQKLLPSARVETTDRLGLDLGDCPITYHPLDLTDPDLDKVDLGQRYDVILFAEVIEHLIANPVRVLRFFIRHLTPNGRIILTTPNFFAEVRLHMMRSRKNPQPIFPEHLDRNTAIEHHVREYSISELLELCVDAGGKPATFFYSSCWDRDPQNIPEEQWLNLVVVIGPT